MKSAKSLVWVALFFLYSTRLFAWNYTNQELGFSVTLPDRLPDFSMETRVKSLVSRGNLDASKGPVEMIIIQDLGGPIGREDLSKKADKPQNVTLEKTGWKSFQIDLFRVVENIRSVPFVTLNAQVPLKPHAIQLTVSGPVSDEDKLRTELQTVLASVNGRTNWLTDEERRARPTTNWLAVMAGLLILITGRLRISRHYGLAGAGARIAGLFILVLGLALNRALVAAVMFLQSFGVNIPMINTLEGVIILITLDCVLIWGALVLLVKQYGNAYQKEAKETASSVQGAVQPPKLPRLIAQCHMCMAPIPPEQQATARTCPTCGADLSRAR